MAESSYNGGEDARGRGQSFNEKFGELRKFASTSFTRARQASPHSSLSFYLFVVSLPLMQFTIEKIGKAESLTTFDTEYEMMSQQLEAIRCSTEKIVAHVLSLIQPNPGP